MPDHLDTPLRRSRSGARTKNLLAATFITMMLAGTGPAALPASTMPASVPSSQATAAPKPCYCRSPEGKEQLGSTRCLSISGQSFLARCELVLNNPNWTLLKKGCPPNV